MEKSQSKEAVDLRNVHEQVANTYVPKLSALLTELAGVTKRLKTLKSVAYGLYEELDKLCKKAPAESLTPLALQQVNDAIEEARTLGPDDVHLQKIKQFVPAGDNPEQRDAVMILRLLQQGLERVDSDLTTKFKQAEHQLADAQALKIALEFKMQGADATKANLEYNGVHPSAYWRVGAEYDYVFDFRRLDRINLFEFFSLAK